MRLGGKGLRQYGRTRRGRGSQSTGLDRSGVDSHWSVYHVRPEVVLKGVEVVSVTERELKVKVEHLEPVPCFLSLFTTIMIYLPHNLLN